MSAAKKLWNSAAVIAICLAVILMSKCPLYYVCGIPCPTCGMTRAYAALLHGDLLGAFKMHPLWWTVPLTAGVVIFRRKRFGRAFWSGFTLLIALFIGTYIVRMILMFPHTAPMNFNANCLILSVLYGGMIP